MTWYALMRRSARFARKSAAFARHASRAITSTLVCAGFTGFSHALASATRRRNNMTAVCLIIAFLMAVSVWKQATR